MDNIRALLIFLVVLGHFSEASSSVKLGYLTEIIYSFHMPLFVFISGYFAGFKPKKILMNYLYPYALLQIIYLIFGKYYLGYTVTALQFSIPQYTLWYLLAMAFYCMLIPLIDTDALHIKILAVILSVMIAITAGFDNNIGYGFAAGKLFAFLPFFVCGYYARKADIFRHISRMGALPRITSSLVLALVGAAALFLIVKNDTVGVQEMAAVFPYSKTGDSWTVRAFLTATALVISAFFLIAVTDKKLPVISYVGKYTFPIYIFHGFIVKIFVKNGITQLSAPAFLAAAILLSLALVLIFGNSIGAAAAKWGFTGHWMSKLLPKNTDT